MDSRTFHIELAVEDVPSRYATGNRVQDFILLTRFSQFLVSRYKERMSMIIQRLVVSLGDSPISLVYYREDKRVSLSIKISKIIKALLPAVTTTTPPIPTQEKKPPVSSKTVTVGIHPTVSFLRTPLSAIEVAKLMEYGSLLEARPPNPIFRQLTATLRRNIDSYWDDFMIIFPTLPVKRLNDRLDTESTDKPQLASRGGIARLGVRSSDTISPGRVIGASGNSGLRPGLQGDVHQRRGILA